MDKDIAISKLEQKNAQFDVWIDEEEYYQIESKFEYNPELLIILDACFKHSHCTSIENADDNWQKILITNKAKPVTPKGGRVIDEYWSKLFYAKLLRSRIQKKGTDCYFRRLDQVVAYLEKNMPDPYKDEKSAKLAVLYLLELAAASLTYESMGFSERARRLLRESKYLEGKANENFRWFHELLARYNIGVAHFHLSNYREAVLEFNYIIFEIKHLINNAGGNTKDNKLGFYNKMHGERLLYLPATIYRADIQLKQQLAYHAFKTLDRCSLELKEKEHEYKKFKADLIKIQAYQFMDNFQDASSILGKLWGQLFNEEQKFPYFDNSNEMIHTEVFNQDIKPGDYRQNIKGRLISLAMDQHLNCLRGRREFLTNEDDQEGSKSSEWINRNNEYLKNLGQNSFISYFKAVEFEAPDRNGYWEQVANYLNWLAESPKKAHRLADIARFCSMLSGERQDKKLIDYLLEKSPREEEDKNKWKCLWCDPKGIELKRLGHDHYDEFCKRMLKALEDQDKLGLIDTKKQDKFIKRLLQVEEARNDLRINDLELRYKSNEVKEKLPPQQGSGEEYCWPQLSDEKMLDKTIRQFELLPCRLNEEEINSFSEPAKKKGDLLPHRRYEQAMERWGDHFLRHLESPSIHERQDPGLYFLGLQRWNSSSPAEGYSLGGGYLIYHLNESSIVDYGIAIDPGFDFIRNLFHMGFSLNDIDIVLISHAHIDHIRDFESIVTLLLELAKQGKRYRKVHVILTLGIYKRLEYIIENPKLRMHIEPYIIDIDREIETDYFEKLPDEKYSFQFKSVEDEVSRLKPIISGKGDYTIRVRPTRAYHDDYSDYSDSFGFLIDVRLPDEKEDVTVGYTGDTKWIYSEVKDPIENDRILKQRRDIKDIIEQYQSCSTLVVHLGSLIKKNKDNRKYSFLKYNQCNSCETRNSCEELVRDEGHPYLIGLLRILSSLYNSDKSKVSLVLLSEFGEELRGKIRVDLVERLIEVYDDKINLLPVDVGINVQLKCESKPKKSDCSGPEEKVLCVQCNRLVAIGEASFEHYGPDEAIYCVCRTCLKGTPFDVLQNRLRQLYEVGYELHTAKRMH